MSRVTFVTLVQDEGRLNEDLRKASLSWIHIREVKWQLESQYPYTPTCLQVLWLFIRLQMAAKSRADDEPPGEGSYLVDPASSHMLVSKIKPCMSKYKLLIL